MESLPVSVVTVANRHWEIVARRTMTLRAPNTHDWWERKPNQEGTSCQPEQAP